MNALDQRTLPASLAAEVSRSTQIAAALRATPAKCLVEGLLALEESGPGAFDDHVVMHYIDQRFGEEALRDYLAKIPEAAELYEVAASVGWKVSPLAAGLRFGSSMMASEPFLAARHLRVVSDAVVDAARGVGPRKIAVSMPYRHGKSVLTSAVTPAWFLGNWPHLQVGLLAYSDTFAATWGRIVRNTITPELFGFSLADDSQAAHQFRTQYDGGLWAVGVGGSAQGRGGNLIIVDDPIKSAEEAHSRVYRDKTWEWFVSTALTRLQDAGTILVVHTRWHSDDLIGRLKSGFEGTDSTEWLFLTLPAIWDKDEPDLIGRRKGEALWPEKRPLSELMSFKASMSEAAWSSGFQQIPLDETGLGRVYHAFEAAKHIRECDWHGGMWIDLRGALHTDGLPLHVGVDFNYDPLSIVIAQVSEEWGERAALTGRKFAICEVLDEISLPESNTAQACEVLVERLRALAGGKMPVVHVHADASGRAHSTKSEENRTDWQIIRRELGEHAHAFHFRFHETKVNPPVKGRVDLVNGLLEQGRLSVHPRCKQLLEDFRQVRWKIDANGRRDTINKSSDPARTHMSDALGYALWGALGPVQVCGEMPGMLF